MDNYPNPYQTPQEPYAQGTPQQAPQLQYSQPPQQVPYPSQQPPLPMTYAQTPQEPYPPYVGAAPSAQPVPQVYYTQAYPQQTIQPLYTGSMPQQAYYPPQTYPQQAPYQAAYYYGQDIQQNAKKAKSKGTAALVLGLASLCSMILVFLIGSGFSVLLFLISLVAGIVGVVMGASSRKLSKEENGIGMAGLVISIISLSLAVLVFIFFMIGVCVACITIPSTLSSYEGLYY